MVEHRLHHPAEQLLVAAKILYLVACHAYHRALHLGWRIKHILINREQIFHIIPRLDEHAENAVGLGTRLSLHALCHLTLNHTRAARNQILVINHLEEYLRRDIVGVIAGQHERLTVEELMEVHAEEVAFDEKARRLLI